MLGSAPRAVVPDANDAVRIPPQHVKVGGRLAGRHGCEHVGTEVIVGQSVEPQERLAAGGLAAPAAEVRRTAVVRALRVSLDVGVGDQDEGWPVGLGSGLRSGLGS